MCKTRAKVWDIGLPSSCRTGFFSSLSLLSLFAPHHRSPGETYQRVINGEAKSCRCRAKRYSRGYNPVNFRTLARPCPLSNAEQENPLFGVLHAVCDATCSLKSIVVSGFVCGRTTPRPHNETSRKYYRCTARNYTINLAVNAALGARVSMPGWQRILPDKPSGD